MLPAILATHPSTSFHEISSHLSAKSPLSSASPSFPPRSLLSQEFALPVTCCGILNFLPISVCGFLKDTSLATHFITGEGSWSPTEINGKIPISFNRARILLKVFKWGLSLDVCDADISVCKGKLHLQSAFKAHWTANILSAVFLSKRTRFIWQHCRFFFISWKKNQIRKHANLYKGFGFFLFSWHLYINIYIYMYLQISYLHDAVSLSTSNNKLKHASW